MQSDRIFYQKEFFIASPCRDLGLNLVGAAMVLELTEENYLLRSP